MTLDPGNPAGGKGCNGAEEAGDAEGQLLAPASTM